MYTPNLKSKYGPSQASAAFRMPKIKNREQKQQEKDKKRLKKDPGDKPEGDGKGSQRSTVIVAAAAGAAAWFGGKYYLSRKTAAKVNQAENVDLSRAGMRPPDASYRIFLSGDEAIAKLKDGSLKPSVEEIGTLDSLRYTYGFETRAGELCLLRGVESGKPRAELLGKLRDMRVDVRTSIAQSNMSGVSQGKSNPWLSVGLSVVGNVVPLILFFWAASRLIRSLKSGADKLMKGDGAKEMAEKPKERFTDVGGNRPILAEMRELNKDIAAYREGDELTQLPRGLLMSGPGGVGKTFCARVLAGDADCLFLYENSSSMLKSSFAGTWTRSVDTLFEKAREARDKGTEALRALEGATGKEREVVIIFLDEFDSLGSARTNGGQGVDEEKTKALNALLAEMDGVEEGKNDGIIIAAATNRLDVIDPALLRPGRFEAQFKLEAPYTTADRLDILVKASKKEFPKYGVEVEDASVLEEIAKVTIGASGDHLRGILARAGKLTRRARREKVERGDLFEAFQQQMYGAADDQMLTSSRRSLVAHHENGHGWLAVAVGLNPMVVSMRPRGESLGRVVFDAGPLSEPPYIRTDLLKNLLITAGGRAGELVEFGVEGTSAGVGSDYEAMGKVARMIITNGMIDGHYAISLDSVTDKELAPDARKMIDNLGDRSVEVARNVLTLIGEETLRAAAEAALDLGEELIGPAAKEFFMSRLDKETLQKIQAVVQDFLKDPLPEKAAEG